MRSISRQVLTQLTALALTFSVATLVHASDALAVDAGATLYQSRCASCHDNPGATKAPSFQSLKQMSLARVFFSMTNGLMKAQAAGLSIPELAMLSRHASVGEQQDYVPSATAMCAQRKVDAAPAVITGWAFNAAGSRALGTSQTRIDSDTAGSLELAWAFGLPGTVDTRSQPVATATTLFVGSAGGHVFALDRLSGCVKWHRATPLRTSLTLGRIQRPDSVIAALFFGDQQGFVTAVDAASGDILWRQHVGLFEASMLTGAVVQHGGTLIVPISSIEVGLASDPTYECCRNHGGVRAIDAATGNILWTTHLAIDATPTTKSAAGVQQWGPSGVPVWSTPTVDAKRGVVYVATGENYSMPATDLSDAIVALDLADGRIRWHFQATAGDAYNTACDVMPPGPNCPAKRGPDFDFGAGVVIADDGNGKELLLAAQKSGVVWALDPDASGKVVWQRQVGAGSALGGVHWGIAVADDRVYVPAADPQFPIPGYEPKPGLYALSVTDGSVVWSHRIERGCEADLMGYFTRTTLYPQCSFYFGLSAAPTALPGAVVAGGLDGKLRIFAAADGKQLWSFATARAYDAVNGIPAHGGAIDAAGAIAVGNMLYAQSGYSLFGQLPGNVLLAFRVQADDEPRSTSAP